MDKNLSARERRLEKETEQSSGTKDRDKQHQKPVSPQKLKSVEDDRDPMKEQREGAIGSREIEDRGDMDM